jgi:hypothetical protein
MGSTTKISDKARCSFCGKHQDNVRLLIAVPGVFICDECVSLCVEILDEKIGRSWMDGIRPCDIVNEIRMNRGTMKAALRHNVRLPRLARARAAKGVPDAH